MTAAPAATETPPEAEASDSLLQKNMNSFGRPAFAGFLKPVSPFVVACAANGTDPAPPGIANGFPLPCRKHRRFRGIIPHKTAV
ncbi:hypothetical protein Fuma_06048 [Fuerstiella marisgermanici]|uniref:Uncharacterized protein n=1 Tax=Fuerstiella marisgermanici TaxID=1891926 RepID=A0A1P8WQQ5_9PLAN|nr:hypothetical protein Fuma_06048 [Fuerstiella marisgermanici]